MFGLRKVFSIMKTEVRKMKKCTAAVKSAPAKEKTIPGWYLVLAAAAFALSIAGQMSQSLNTAEPGQISCPE
jgi:hypothetical protein